jgi:DNA-directed RNA polymerase subunit H
LTVSPEHVLVPRHEVLSDEEREKFFASSGLRPEQLPKINAGDPAIKAEKAEEGDVVRIIRKSDVEGKGEVAYYRIVID